MDVTQLGLSGVGYFGKRQKTCTDLRASLFSTEVNSSQVNAWFNGLARRPNLYVFASPFGGLASRRGGDGELFTIFSGNTNSS